MMMNSHNFEDANDEDGQRDEETRAREQANYYRWCHASNLNLNQNAAGPSGATPGQPLRNPSAEPGQQGPSGAAPGLLLRNPSAAPVSFGAGWSTIGGPQQSVGATWGSASAALVAAEATVEDIRHLLNDLTAAMRSAQLAPDRGVEAVVPMLRDLTNLTDMHYGRIRVLQGGNKKNGGWPKYDGTYKNYKNPSFKRKWELYKRTRVRQQNEKEKVQQFMEYCLAKEAADYFRRMETMATAWATLDVFYDCPLNFVKELMAELTIFRPIGELEFDKLLKFYVKIQIAVDESVKSDLRSFLLIAANVEIIVSKLLSRQQMIW